MPFWYNESRDGGKFSSLFRSDWNECNATITFTELGIKESDDFYYLYMNATSVNDVVKSGAGKDWRFEPQLTSLKIAKKSYVKQDYKTKKDIAVEQHRIEKFFCQLLAKYDLSQVYNGFLFMQDGGIVDMLLSGIDGAGKPIAPETIQMMSTPYLSLEIVENPELIKIDEIELPSNKFGSGKGYSSGQTELAKLNDRLSFVISQMKLKLPDVEIQGIADIYKTCSDPDAEKASTAIAIWEYCTFLIK